MNYWIFQCNTKQYRLDERLADSNNDAIAWLVKQHKKEVHKGDIAFLWRSRGGDKLDKRGIYAVLEVTTEPKVDKDIVSEFRYYVKQPVSKPTKGLRVEAQILQRQFLSRDDILKHPKLQELSILKNCMGTNFSVTQQEGEALTKLLASMPKK